MMRRFIFQVLLALYFFFYYGGGCMPVQVRPTPTTTTTPGPDSTTTTISPNQNCCAPLQVFISTDPAFGFANMTFAYNNDDCRSTVVATCSRDPDLSQVTVAIVANDNAFLQIEDVTAVQDGYCSNGSWFMAEPPLEIMRIECRLTNA